MKYIIFHNSCLDAIESIKSELSSDMDDSTALVFCMHLYKKSISEFKKEYNVNKVIIFNSEQYFTDFFDANYKKLLNECDEIWDYDEKNIEYIKTITKVKIKHHIIYPFIKLNKLDYCDKQYDVLFYGELKPRRAEILNKLKALGVNVCVVNKYGDDLNYYLERSKCLLNIHAYREDTPQEQARLCRVKGNCHIISEKSIKNYYNVDEYEYDRLVDGVVEFLTSYKKRNNGEKLIVTLTSWKKRIQNIPTVLKTILENTKRPDKIVLNLSSKEFSNKEKDLPNEVIDFFDKNKDVCEIFWVDGPNYKNWKKTLPTLHRFQNDCIINIDDDFLYPSDMIETLWAAHLQHPNNPISGNRCNISGKQCQCGCASLVKLEYLDNIFDYATDEVKKMNSDDVFFTYVAAKCGHEFVYCGKDFFTNMTEFNEVDGLHYGVMNETPELSMWNYMTSHYGNVDDKNLLICCHIYHFDIWKNDIEKRLLDFKKRLQFDLYITLTNDIDRKKHIKDIKHIFPNATIEVIENLGEDARNFASCVEWLRKTKKRYDYVLKIHTKHENEWRKNLLDCLIRSDDNFVDNVLYNGFGFYASKKYYKYSDNPLQWNFNGQWLDEERSMINCNTRTTNHFSGTMFWISYDILEKYFINSEKFCQEYFDQPYSVGYTKQHSFELLIGCVSQDCGKKIIVGDYDEKQNGYNLSEVIIDGDVVNKCDSQKDIINISLQPKVIRSLPPKTNKIFMPDVSFEERPDMLALYIGTDFVYPFKGSNVQTVHAEDGSYSIGFKKFIDLVFENKYKWILCMKDTIRFIGNTTVSNKIKQIVNSESNIGIYTPSSLYANQNSPSKRQYKTGYCSVNEISDDMFLVNVSALNGMKDIDFSMCRTGAGFMKYLCSVVKGNGYSIVIDDSICYTKNFINTASDEVIERNSVWLIRENGIDTSILRTPPIKTNIQ